MDQCMDCDEALRPGDGDLCDRCWQASEERAREFEDEQREKRGTGECDGLCIPQCEWCLMSHDCPGQCGGGEDCPYVALAAKGQHPPGIQDAIREGHVFPSAQRGRYLCELSVTTDSSPHDYRIMGVLDWDTDGGWRWAKRNSMQRALSVTSLTRRETFIVRAVLLEMDLQFHCLVIPLEQVDIDDLSADA